METYGTTVAGRPERAPTEWEQRVLDAVQEKAASGLIECYLGPDMPLVLIHARSIGAVAEALADTGAGEGFPFLLDVTAVDYSASDEETPARFAVVWHFLDPSRGRRVRVKAFVSEEGEVPSLTDRFASADWAEREVFDMMGIRFSGHPNLKRILMPDSYEGHPQRKDFPTQGPERGKRIHGEILGNKPLTSWKELHEI